MSLLTAEEKIYFIPLSIIILLVFVEAILSKNKLKIFSPIVFIAAVYAFYTVVSPFIMLQVEEEILFGAINRSFYKSAWLGSLISMLALLAGFYFPKKYHPISATKKKIKLQNLFFWGVFLNLTGFLIYASLNPAKTIGQLNPFSVSELQLSGVDYEGSIKNYFKNCVNFLIAGNCLILLSLQKKAQFSSRTLMLLFWLFITIAIYTSLGFRFRIALLTIGLGTCYYMKEKQRPNFSLFLLGIPVFVVLMGVIGASRDYSKGLNLNAIEGKTSSELLLKGMMEANIFLFSGAVLNSAPNRMEHVGIEPIKQAILYPIPSKFFPQKNSSRYLRKAIAVHPSLKAIAAHEWAAFMFYAEWYLAFGWLGLITTSFLVGLIYRNLWRWVIVRLEDYFAIALYAVCLSFSYFLLSRGYFPYMFMFFFFYVFPILAIYKLRHVVFFRRQNTTLEKRLTLTTNNT